MHYTSMTISGVYADPPLLASLRLRARRRAAHEPRSRRACREGLDKGPNDAAGDDSLVNRLGRGN